MVGFRTDDIRGDTDDAPRLSAIVTALAQLYDVADSRSIRDQIINALGSRKEPEATDKLNDIVKNGTDPNLRSHAINTLSACHAPSAAPHDTLGALRSILLPATTAVAQLPDLSHTWRLVVDALPFSPPSARRPRGGGPDRLPTGGTIFGVSGRERAGRRPDWMEKRTRPWTGDTGPR